MVNKENTRRELAYLKATKRVKALKSLYKHIAIYFIVNLFFIGRRIYKETMATDNLVEALTDLSNYSIFYFWGIGLLIHFITVYKVDFLFGKDWEQRETREATKKK